MENIIDLIATDASANEISDSIKNVLFAKAAEKIDSIRPEVAASIFGEPEVDEDSYEESYENAYENESEDYEES